MLIQTFALERLGTPTGLVLIVTDDEHRLRAVDWEDCESRMQRLLQRDYGRELRLRDISRPSAARKSLQAYFDVQATDLPVSADLENGFGESPETVAETIRLAALTGLVGGSIEDATGNPAKPLYDLTHAVERVAAAAEAARSDPHSFVLTARAENFLRGNPDLDDTIERLQAFEKAGADVLFAPGLPDLEGVHRVPLRVQASEFHGWHKGQIVHSCRTAGRRRASNQLCHVALPGSLDWLGGRSS